MPYGNRNRLPREGRGVVLVFTAGILTILAAMGMAFFALTQSTVVSATRYSDMVRAELLAQAGLHDAVAQLRHDLFIKTENAGDRWCTTQWLDDARRQPSFSSGNGLDDNTDGIVDNELNEPSRPYSRALSSSVGDQSDRYVLEVEDAAGKINVNACDNLAAVLDNLCRVIGPPLVAADPDALQPRRWREEGAPALYYDTATNADDTRNMPDRCYRVDTAGRPLVNGQGEALFGDGYAIAGWRGRNGPFGSVNEVRQALTYVERNSNGQPDDPLEILEQEAKFAALKPHLTTGSWVDTQSVCVGKFEWVLNDKPLTVRNLLNGSVENDIYCQVLVDREKSWVEDRPAADPQNNRGSLRGCYLALVNGQGQGQLRRIATNGTDWVALRASGPDERFTIEPGPITSYMIIAPEDALLIQRQISASGRTALFPSVLPDGSFEDHPSIDYANRPLCIHRAPVNINTASDKVLTALFMGLNVQHGHPLSVGTAAPSSTDSTTDLHKLSKYPRPALYNKGASSATLSTPCTIAVAEYTDWYAKDPNEVEPFLLTPKGLKRVPADSGKLVFDTAYVLPAAVTGSVHDLRYVNQYGQWGLNEAHLLAMRILIAREKAPAYPYINRTTGLPMDSAAAVSARFDRGPFLNWDDLYFRVVKPWDDERYESGVDGAGNAHKASVARMIMANFNSNLDLLKFNPGIEWIDRFGRNFTEMEPVMTFKGSAGGYGPGWVSNAYTNGDPTYCLRAMRYRSDELIDKTDLDRSTTEFSFMSNGTFEVRSTGQVVQPATGQLLAERKVSALVKVYDVWRESTQEQFVRGTFSDAEGNSSVQRNTISGVDSTGATNRGRITRDRENDVLATPRYKALDTLPEPLVPRTFRLEVDTAKYGDVIDGRPTAYGSGNWPGARNLGHDVFGNPKTLDNGRIVPDILANQVLPSRYDGQIVLATNTSVYANTDATVMDTFLATFDGDLDTATCAGNGREQAKVPKDPTKRVQDLIGLLGLLNDVEEDSDPDDATNFRFLVKVPQLPKITSAIDPDPVTGDTTGRTAYWNHCGGRQGDLRAEGVHMGMLGTSYKDGVLKYAAGQHLGKDSYDGPSTYAGINYDPRNANGGTLTMWFKSEWHHDDFRHHEFFNATQAGTGAAPRSGGLWKVGRWCDNFVGAGERIVNDLLVFFEDDRDADRLLSLHGGWAEVSTFTNLKDRLTPPSNPPESPAYHVQPFRWNHIGCRYKGNSSCDTNGAVLERCKGVWHVNESDAGFWDPDNDPDYLMACNFVAGTWTGTKWDDTTKGLYRNFISTQRHPEGPNYNPKDMFWFSMTTYREDPLRLTPIGAVGAPAAFRWADGGASDTVRDGPTGIISRTACFAVNPPNELYRDPTNPNIVLKDSWLYRMFPTDGTYAVIDEYRLSKCKWTTERIAAEQTLSRYYLPKNPENRTGCPFFTSQTLAESLRGSGAPGCSQRVTPVRVYWNAFTPRFMHEWKLASESGYERQEIIASRSANKTFVNPASTTVAYRGPFNYPEYNRDIGLDYCTGWKAPDVNPVDEYRGVTRDYPAAGTQPHATQGVEVQLVNASTGSIYPGPTTAFINPSANNPVGSPVAPVSLLARDLQYRVIFRYPIDRNVDPRSVTAGGRTDGVGRLTVNPDKHYLLDTPVFDDVSVVYFQALQFLDFRSDFE